MKIKDDNHSIIDRLEHDFKGNIRNQTNIYQDVIEMIKENEAIDKQYIDFISEVKKRMNKLWDELIDLMENNNKHQ